jgi:hypothetical protein
MSVVPTKRVFPLVGCSPTSIFNNCLPSSVTFSTTELSASKGPELALRIDADAVGTFKARTSRDCIIASSPFVHYLANAIPRGGFFISCAAAQRPACAALRLGYGGARPATGKPAKAFFICCNTFDHKAVLCFKSQAHAGLMFPCLVRD